jgi:hypothetical protein
MLPGWRTPRAPHTGKSARVGLEKWLACRPLADETKDASIPPLPMQEYDVALRLVGQTLESKAI